MPDRRLQEKFRGLAEALYPDDVLRQERAVAGALNADGTVRTDAITAALPWQRIDFHVSGPVILGTSPGGIYELPQGGIIHRVSAHARIAPSSGPCTYRLLVNGVATDYSASIQEGSTKEISGGVHIVVPAGGIVTMNVMADGAAEGLTVSVFYGMGAA